MCRVGATVRGNLDTTSDYIMIDAPSTTVQEGIINYINVYADPAVIFNLCACDENGDPLPDNGDEIIYRLYVYDNNQELLSSLEDT